MSPLSITDASPLGLKRPSKQAIAFAITTVTSKPEDLSIREYINLLRLHIAKSRRDHALSTVHRHLDRSAHWRSEYERVKDALRAAESETVDLQMEVERLKAQIHQGKTAPGATKKRKKVDEDVIKAPRSPKRVKRDASPTRRGGVGELDVEKEFDFSEVGEVGNILMRSLYQAHAVLKSHQRTEPAVLAHHLVRTASALPQVVHQAVRASFARPFTGHEILKTTLTAAGKGVVSLVVGITRLDHSADGAEVIPPVVYAYVKMFAGLIGTLEEVAELEARKAKTQTKATPADKRPSAGKGKTSAQQPKQPNIKDTASLNTITRFLCGIIDLLDAEKDAHKQLFEGFAYCTLNRLGARLYTCVFGHARRATIEDEIIMSNQPDEIEDTDMALTEPTPTHDVGQAKMEAPYLVHLLSRLMAAAPAHFGAIISTKTGKAKQASNKGSMKGALAIHAKDRLQSTLVNCIFGMEGVDEDDPFMDCLKMPSMAGRQPLPTPKVKEVEVQDWFKEEVWRLLGWEILSNEGNW